MAASSFRVSWNRFPSHVLSALDNLRLDEDFVDVSIYCGRRLIKAHRNVLSASSAYFKEIFKSNPSSHPVVILCDVDHASLRSLVDFMYHGEIEVPTARLDELLRLGEMLQVQGISSHKGVTPENPSGAPAPAPPDPEPPLPPGDVIAPECVITEPAGGGATVAPCRRRRRSRRRTASAGEEGGSHVTPAAGHVAMDGAHDLLAAGGHVTTAGSHVMPTIGQGSAGSHAPAPTLGLGPNVGPGLSAVGHGLPAAGHGLPAAGRGLSSTGPMASTDLAPASVSTAGELADVAAGDGAPLPQLRVKTEWPEESEREPTAAPDTADTKLLLDDSEQSGLDMSQYSGGIFAGTVGSRRPLTGAERARRYRERKKLKKLYEALLGGSPRREQLTVQL